MNSTRVKGSRRFVRFTLAAALAGAIGVGLSSSSAQAVGGVKVDDDAFCTDQSGEKAIDRQENILVPGSIGYVWLNLPKGLDGSYTYTLYNDNGDPVGPIGLAFTGCGGDSNWYYASFTVPSAEGTYTIKVDSSEGNVGGDAFQVVIPVA
jgi:hypothetical protein